MSSTFFTQTCFQTIIYRHLKQEKLSHHVPPCPHLTICSFTPLKTAFIPPRSSRLCGLGLQLLPLLVGDLVASRFLRTAESALS